jgi:hypothetical protein
VQVGSIRVQIFSGLDSFFDIIFLLISIPKFLFDNS